MERCRISSGEKTVKEVCLFAFVQFVLILSSQLVSWCLET